jgi:outer membrane protein TolC
MRAHAAEAWVRRYGFAAMLLFGIVLGPCSSWAQTPTSPYQGSVVERKASPEVLPLSLDQAIQMGLKDNLGLILAGESVRQAGGQRLQVLQPLLPLVNGSLTESVQQIDLQAEGFRFPGFPAVIGPYSYTDLRGSLSLSLIDLPSLRNYLAAKNNFTGANLSAQDAKDMVVLTVGNAYLLCISGASRIELAQALVNTSKVSLDQAMANHDAGTAPLLDVLRARVDFQTEQQNLITAQNQYEKSKIALARAIGLPLDQKFELTDKLPYVALDNADPSVSVPQALDHRQDLKALEQQAAAAKQNNSAAAEERYPQVAFSGTYGDIGTTLGHSHGTFDATGVASVPIFDEAKLRGDAHAAEAQLDQAQAQVNNLRGQIEADVRDSILDIQAAAKQVEVATSNLGLANEALSEAQQRYSAGVSDNLAVSQAQASVAQADDQYVASLYQHNVAKLSLARALGTAETSYRNYLGGK